MIGFPKFNSGFLASLLPEEVFSSECLGSFYGFPLIGKEKEISRSFSSKRLKEFSVGRKCARNALSHLGFNDPPILIGTNREPIWPKNICGSITHCRGYAAAAVTSDYRFRTIGIDAEPNNPIESEIYSLIMSKKEIKQMGELTCSQPNISWDRLTFSAKESVYKAWFPTYGKWLDFTDCEVMFYLDSHRPNNQPKELVVGRYHAQLLKSKRSYSCNGQWAFVPFFNLLITTTAGSLTES